MLQHDAPTAVYRLYGVDEELLYVGISANIEVRWQNHATYSATWWPLVRREEIEWHADRYLALAHEYLAIISESPIHNRRRTAPHTERWRNREAAALLASLPEQQRPYR